MRIDLDLVSFLSIFVPAIIALILIRRLSGSFKILATFIFGTALLEIGVAVFYYSNWNNLFLFHIHTYLEFLLLSFLFLRLISNVTSKKLILAIVPVFLIYSIFSLVLMEDASGFNSIQRNVEGLLITIFAFLFLAEGKQENNRSAPTLLSVALIFYFTVNIFLFISARNMFLTGEDASWVVHGISNILLNFCFSVSLLLDVRYSSRN